MHIERRRHRSSDQLQALRNHLDACCRRAQLDGMVVADKDGLSVAAAGDEDACAEAAALMAVFGRRMENYEGALRAPEGRWHMRGRKVLFNDEPLYVCAVGGGGESRAVQIQRSIDALNRILGAD
jgi:hypothetical protein